MSVESPLHPPVSTEEEADEAPRPFLDEDWGATILGVALILSIVFGIITKGVFQ